MTTTAFKITNITWNFNDIKGITLLPDANSLPIEEVILHDDLDIDILPDKTSYNYEAELEWMIGGYLAEKYSWYAETFNIETIEVEQDDTLVDA